MVGWCGFFDFPPTLVPFSLNIRTGPPLLSFHHYQQTLLQRQQGIFHVFLGIPLWLPLESFLLALKKYWELLLGMGMHLNTNQSLSRTRPVCGSWTEDLCELFPHELPMKLHVFHGVLCGSWKGLWARYAGTREPFKAMPLGQHNLPMSSEGI